MLHVPSVHRVLPSDLLGETPSRDPVGRSVRDLDTFRARRHTRSITLAANFPTASAFADLVEAEEVTRCQGDPNPAGRESIDGPTSDARRRTVWRKSADDFDRACAGVLLAAFVTLAACAPVMEDDVDETTTTQGAA